MKTSGLTGPALDWAVAIAGGIPITDIHISGKSVYTALFRRTRDEDGELDGMFMTGPDLNFSKKWEAGGPIIEREKISVDWNERLKRWDASTGTGYIASGPTALIAAMRCYCCAALGFEIEIPEELIR